MKNYTNNDIYEKIGNIEGTLKQALKNIGDSLIDIKTWQSIHESNDNEKFKTLENKINSLASLNVRTGIICAGVTAVIIKFLS